MSLFPYAIQAPSCKTCWIQIHQLIIPSSQSLIESSPGNLKISSVKSCNGQQWIVFLYNEHSCMAVQKVIRVLKQNSPFRLGLRLPDTFGSLSRYLIIFAVIFQWRHLWISCIFNHGSRIQQLKLSSNPRWIVLLEPQCFTRVPVLKIWTLMIHLVLPIVPPFRWVAEEHLPQMKPAIGLLQPIFIWKWKLMDMRMENIYTNTLSHMHGCRLLEQLNYMLNSQMANVRLHTTT